MYAVLEIAAGVIAAAALLLLVVWPAWSRLAARRAAPNTQVAPKEDAHEPK